MDNKKAKQLEELMSQFNQDSKKVVQLLENINQFCEGTHQASSLLRIFSALKFKDKSKEELDEILSRPPSPSSDENFPLNLANSKLIPPGTHCICMWSRSAFQYFTATVVKYEPETKTYLIDWDDKDPTGRNCQEDEIAEDRTPKASELAVGIDIFFAQGNYGAAPVEGVARSACLRWHRGKITNIYKDIYGTTFVDGVHSKTAEDGKWVTYKDYVREFKGKKLEDIRIGHLSHLEYLEKLKIREKKLEKTGFYLSCGQYKSKIVDNLEPELNKVNSKLIVKRTPAEFNGVVFKYRDQEDRSNPDFDNLESAKVTSAKMMRNCNFFVVFLDNYTLTDDLHQFELDHIKKQKNVIYVISEQLQIQSSLISAFLAVGSRKVVFYDNDADLGQKVVNQFMNYKSLINNLAGKSENSLPPAGTEVQSSSVSNSNPQSSHPEIVIIYSHKDFELAKKVYFWMMSNLLETKISEPWIEFEKCQFFEDEASIYTKTIEAIDNSQFVISLSTENAYFRHLTNFTNKKYIVVCENVQTLENPDLEKFRGTRFERVVFGSIDVYEVKVFESMMLLMIERLMYLIRDTDLAEKLNKYLLKRIPVRGADERLNVEDPTAPPPMYVDDDEHMVENFETAILPDSDVLNESSQQTQENATTQATDLSRYMRIHYHGSNK